MTPLLRAVRTGGRRSLWFVTLAGGGTGIAGDFATARELARGFRWMKARKQGA